MRLYNQGPILWVKTSGYLVPALGGLVLGLMTWGTGYSVFVVSGVVTAPALLIISIMVIATLFVLCYGHGMKIDQQRATAHKTFRLFIWTLSFARQSIAEAHEVSLRKVIHRYNRSSGGHRTRTLIEVGLSFADGRKPVVLCAWSRRCRNQARRLAERVADHLELGMCDSTSGNVIRRPAGQLNKSVAQCLLDYRKAHGELPVVAKPEHGRVQWRQVQGGAEAVFPLAVPWIWLVIGMVLLALGAPPFATIGYMVPVIIMGCAALALFLGLLVALARLRPASLRIDHSGLHYRGFTWTRSIPQDELEEWVAPDVEITEAAVIAGGNGITAASDRIALSIGAGLRHDEIAYLHSKAQQVMASVATHQA